MSKYDVSKFRNVTVALNTPFKKDGSVDIDAIKAVCRYFRDKGIKQMYVCGSTGEGFLLDTEERMLVAETVVNEVGQDMNIIVHVGCPDTRHSCILAAHAEKIGAAATSAVPCVYYRPSEESVYLIFLLVGPFKYFVAHATKCIPGFRKTFHPCRI